VKPTLKAPGPKHLKLQYDRLLSSFAFSFKLRRYTLALPSSPRGAYGTPSLSGMRQGLTLVHFSAQPKRFLWDKGCFRGDV
jgi:hypothetical protein